MVNAEDFLLRIQVQGGAQAQAATSAMAKLEAQVIKATAAFDAQGLKVDDFASRLDAAQRRVKELSNSSTPPGMLVKAKEQAADLALKLEIARGKLDVLAARLKQVGMASAAPEENKYAVKDAEAKSALSKNHLEAQLEVGKFAVASANDAATANGKETASLGKKTTALRQVAVAQKSVSVSVTAASNGSADLSRAFGILGQYAGGAGSQIAGMANGLMGMGPGAIAAVIGIMLVASSLALLVAIFSKGVGAANAYRDSLLKLQGAFEGNASTALDVAAAISAVSSGSALGRDKITDYATQLGKAKLQGEELRRALEAMAIAGSVGGESAASAFLASVKAAKAAGSSVNSLSDDVKKKLGGVAAAQARSLSVQFTKLGENITDVFSGADIEPLLVGIQAILRIFDPTSASAKNLKATITGMVEAAIGGMLRAAIAAVQLYTAIKRNETAWTTLKITGLIVLAVLGAIVGAFLLGAAVMLAAGALMAAPFIYLIAGATKAFNWLKSVNLGEIAAGLIAGLAGGILGGSPAVTAAIKSVVDGAIKEAKSLLGIASPSKVFKSIGRFTGEGLTEGFDDSAPEVKASAGGMVRGATNAASQVAAPAKGGGAVSKGREIVNNFINCTFGNVSQEEIDTMTKISLAKEFGGAEPA